MGIHRYTNALWLVCLLSIVSSPFGSPARDTLVVFRFENNTSDPALTQFHLLLSRQLENELFFPDLVITSSADPFSGSRPDAVRARFIIHGRFDPDSTTPEQPLMTFRIEDSKNGTYHQKKIPLQGMSPEDLARVVVLKTGNRLRERVLGRLNIASTPAGCLIFLDNVKTGSTPKEFSLQPGRYTLELHGDFLSPFKGEVELVEGKPVNLNIHMNFKGYPTLHWLTGAFVCTGLSMIMYVTERAAYREYQDLALYPLEPPPKGNPYEPQYRAYRNARLVRLIFQQGAVAGWTGTGFCFFINRSIQRRIFGRKN